MNIEIKNVNKSYDEKLVLKDLSLMLPDKKCTVIMGASGCGKTTLLRILMGLEKADSGTINGMPKNISVVFQENRLCMEIDALTNVMLVTKDREKALLLLNQLGLGDSLNKPLNTLSGGMQRRVAIARALLAKSDLILFDEPFKGLDADTKRTVMQIVKDYIKNKTSVIVTHNEDEALFFAENKFNL